MITYTLSPRMRCKPNITCSTPWFGLYTRSWLSSKIIFIVWSNPLSVPWTKKNYINSLLPNGFYIILLTTKFLPSDVMMETVSNHNKIRKTVHNNKGTVFKFHHQFKISFLILFHFWLINIYLFVSVIHFRLFF